MNTSAKKPWSPTRVIDYAGWVCGATSPNGMNWNPCGSKHRTRKQAQRHSDRLNRPAPCRCGHVKKSHQPPGQECGTCCMICACSSFRQR